MISLPSHRLRTLPFLLATLPGIAWAQDANSPDRVMVTATRAAVPLNAVSVDADTLKALRAATSDTASLLRSTPGVSLYGAGGASSLPAIRGLADDRLRIKVDGMDLVASCPNHMNPPLSYLDPSNVGTLTVYAGIAPVSVGGDSIGGTIIAETAPPKFAEAGEGTLVTGEIGGFYRSNGDAFGGNVSITAATESISLTYTGAHAESDNYKAGGDFKEDTARGKATGRIGHTLPLDEVGSSAYRTQTQTLGAAFRNENHLVAAELGLQNVPEQLYPNQRMDMLDNEQTRFNLHYLGQFDWGSLDGRAFYEKVDHFMDFGPDKRYWYGTGKPPTGSGGASIGPRRPRAQLGEKLGGTIGVDASLGRHLLGDAHCLVSRGAGCHRHLAGMQRHVAELNPLGGQRTQRREVLHQTHGGRDPLDAGARQRAAPRRVVRGRREVQGLVHIHTQAIGAPHHVIAAVQADGGRVLQRRAGAARVSDFGQTGALTLVRRAHSSRKDAFSSGIEQAKEIPAAHIVRPRPGEVAIHGTYHQRAYIKDSSLSLRLVGLVADALAPSSEGRLVPQLIAAPADQAQLGMGGGCDSAPMAVSERQLEFQLGAGRQMHLGKAVEPRAGIDSAFRTAVPVLADLNRDARGIAGGISQDGGDTRDRCADGQTHPGRVLFEQQPGRLFVSVGIA